MIAWCQRVIGTAESAWCQRGGVGAPRPDDVQSVHHGVSRVLWASFVNHGVVRVRLAQLRDSLGIGCRSTVPIEQFRVWSLSGLIRPGDVQVHAILLSGMRQSEARAPVSKYTDLVEEAEGLDKIEMLQNHADPKIYEKAVEILECFFGFGAEDKDEEVSKEEDEERPGGAGGASMHLAESAAPAAATYTFTPVAAPAEGFQFALAKDVSRDSIMIS
eukprot:1194412-Prorocentrum_minimum.AAC.3